jgi:hypothetical protein
MTTARGPGSRSTPLRKLPSRLESPRRVQLRTSRQATSNGGWIVRRKFCASGHPPALAERQETRTTTLGGQESGSDKSIRIPQAGQQQTAGSSSDEEEEEEEQQRQRNEQQQLSEVDHLIVAD